MEAATVSAIISATAGISGVVLGGAITTWKDVWLAKRKTHTDAQYLAILLGTDLGLYIDACMAVAFDDGREEGPWSDFEERSPRTETPVFNPRDLDVEWKSLPPDLLDDIFSLPKGAGELRARLSQIEEYISDPPDHPEYFWQRRTGWAEIGLDVSAIVRRLRKHAGLPSPAATDFLRMRDARLHEAIREVENERKQVADRIARRRAERDAAAAADPVAISPEKSD
jgi:hypothetical protein